MNAADIYRASRFGKTFDKAFNVLPRASTSGHAYTKRRAIDFATACVYYWAKGEEPR